MKRKWFCYVQDEKSGETLTELSNDLHTKKQVLRAADKYIVENGILPDSVCIQVNDIETENILDYWYLWELASLQKKKIDKQGKVQYIKWKGCYR